MRIHIIVARAILIALLCGLLGCDDKQAESSPAQRVGGHAAGGTAPNGSTNPITSQPSTQAPTARTLVVRKAIYGDLPDGPTIDVTDKVRGLVKNGSLHVEPIPLYLDVDPAKGVKPTITRVYMNVPNLNLGGPNGAADITDRVKEMVTFTISNPVTIYYRYGEDAELSKKFAAGETAGVPPYLPYTLHVDYTLDGVDKSESTQGWKGIDINVSTTQPFIRPPSPRMTDPVFTSAVKSGDLEKVKALLKKNPKLVSGKDENGLTPLHFAAEAGHKDVVEFLLANHADPHAETDSGWTPLGFAMRRHHDDVVDLLRDAADRTGNSGAGK